MKKSDIQEYVIAFLFTFAGGFCDAYTLIYRRGLFANMQTGNLVKFCISLADGSFEPMYFLPIICFLLGCLIAILVNKKKSHNIVLLIVMLALTIGCIFMPSTDTWNVACVCLLSVTGAIQFEAFHQCVKTTYTSTMCTNNRRLLMESTVEFASDKKNKRVFFFLGIILCFGLGAVISALIGKLITIYSISIVAGIYLAILIMLIVTRNKSQETTVNE